MCELDVFVGNYATIDWELYSLWLSGRSVAEAVAVFVRDNRQTITEFHVSQDMIVSDFEDNWRLFTTIEQALMSHESTTPLQLLDLGTKKRVVDSYHSLDSIFCREILGRKLNSKLRKDLDEVSDKTGIFVRSCRRQFDNIKKVFKAIEDLSPKNYVNSIISTFGLSKNLAEKYAALVFAALFRLEFGKKKLAFLGFDQVKVVSLMIINDWGEKDESSEPSLDREFLASLKEMKVLLDKEKEHRSAVLTKLANSEMSPTTLNELEANFKSITRSIVGFAISLANNKDIKEVFVQLVEKPIEAFKAISATPATVDLFLRAYADVIKDNIILVDNDTKLIVSKFMKTLRPALLAIYE